MAGFGDLIWQLAGNEDPRIAMMRAVAGGNSTPVAGGSTPAAPGTGGGTAAPASTPQPDAYTSPPDLMQLYAELGKREQFSQGINNGLGLIMASFARPENKESIIDTFSGGSGSDTLTGGGGTDPLEFMTGLMKFQAGQAELKQRAANRAALPAIAKQYGLDLLTAQYLFDAGKLDAVIAEAEKPNKQITKMEDGRSVIVDLSDGSLSDPFGPAKQRETEIVKDERTGRQFAVWKDNKEPVGGKDIVEGSRKTRYKKLPDGSEILVYDDTEEPVPGKSAMDIPAPPKKVEFIDDGRGGKKAVYEDGTPVPDKDIPGLGATEKEQLYNASKENWVKSGKPIEEFPILEDWLKEQGRISAGTSNLGVSGIDYGDPPTDMAWKRDAKGTVMTDDQGAPIPVPLEGTKLWLEKRKQASKEGTRDVNEIISGSIVGKDIDRSIDNILANKDNWIPTTGYGALLDFVPSSSQMQLADNIETIRANVGKDALQAMRAGNDTGGALGNVSDFENRLMQATLGNLNTMGKPEDVIYNLRRIRAIYGAIITKGIDDQAEAARILEAIPYPSPEEMGAKYKGDADPTVETPLVDDAEIEALIKKHTKAK